MDPHVRAMIVEDEIIIAWDLKIQLERLGSEVVAISDNADRAVGDARDKHPDIIFMDIILKGSQTGIDAALRIRSFSDVPIVYITGNTHLLDDSTMRATRAQGLCTKPVNRETIISMLRYAAGV